MSAKELYLEPMTVGMILDRTFRLYVQNFALMVGLTAIVHVPLLIIGVSAPLLRGTSLAVLEIPITVLGYIVSFVFVAPLVMAAATKAISERYLGNEITIKTALQFAWTYIRTLIIVNIVIGLIILAGYVLCIVPGILWGLSYLLVVPVTVLENSMDRPLIRRRSWNLVRDNRFKVFIVLFVLVFPQMIVGISSSIFLASFFGVGSAMGDVLGALITGALALLFAPLSAIAVTLLYYDLRIRKEGFDLEMLSFAIENPATPE